MYFQTIKVELFTPMLTKSEYIQDIRNIVSYVGPYISDVYIHLRAQNLDTTAINAAPIAFQPMSDEDPMLTDPLLVICRRQIKAWIDSGKLMINKKFSNNLQGWDKEYDISYSETSKALHVNHTYDSITTVYIV